MQAFWLDNIDFASQKFFEVLPKSCYIQEASPFFKFHEEIEIAVRPGILPELLNRRLELSALRVEQPRAGCLPVDLSGVR